MFGTKKYFFKHEKTKHSPKQYQALMKYILKDTQFWDESKSKYFDSTSTAEWKLEFKVRKNRVKTKTYFYIISGNRDKPWVCYYSFTLCMSKIHR